MNITTGLLVLTLAGCIALPTLSGPEDDLSSFFDYNDASSRIVGGTEAAIGSHPHMVGLTAGVSVRGLVCGASLISRRTVLTAAHCLDYINIASQSVRAQVGTNRWNFGGTSYALMPHSVIHHNYVPYTYVNDIAIVYTTSNVVFNNLVRPVTLGFSFVPGGVRARVAGWGRTSLGGSTPVTLMELTTTTLDGNDCVNRWASAAALNPPPVDPATEICTFHSTGRGFCHLDSGSSLTRVDNGQQIGIVSWMFPCARGYPDVYVRISAHQSWLQRNMIN